MGKIEKFFKYMKERGVLWTFLYVIRFVGSRIVRGIDMYIIRIEKRKFLTGDSTVSAMYHTVEDNKRWNRYDWSTNGGEEWTQDVKKYKDLDPEKWKSSIINEMMLKYIKKGSTVLEIGPGAGRWTEILQPISSRLLIADIAEKCLAICKERFKEKDNIEYYRVEEDMLSFIPEDAIEFIWSYDVFVHINATDTEKYLIDFKRIMKPGSYAVIHHADKYSSMKEARKAARSHMDGKLFAHLVEKYDFKIVEQNDTLVHMPGDLITVFFKP